MRRLIPAMAVALVGVMGLPVCSATMPFSWPSAIARAQGVSSDEDGPVEVSEVRVGRLSRAVGRDRVPIVAAVGLDASGEVHPIPLDEAARALVGRLKPKKYVRLSEHGGLHRADCSVVDYLNLALDAETLARGRIPRRDDRPVLGAVRAVLAAGSEKTSAQLTSPTNFLRELFTAKGAGTLVKTGTAIDEFDSFRAVNRDRLRRLIETSFGRRLARGYFKIPVRSIFLDREYRGVAVVRPLGRFTYLDKFAVLPQRGLGVALIALDKHPIQLLIVRSDFLNNLFIREFLILIHSWSDTHT